MPALVGLIERYHQYWYDTLCHGVATAAAPIGPGNGVVTTRTQLFSGQNLGQLAWTNMRVAAQFTGSRTLQIKAVRVGTIFRAGLLTEFKGYFPAYSVHRLYMQCQMQLFWTLIVGDKPMLVAGTHYIPLGSGIWGDIGSDTTLVVMNNANATQDALLRLGRPIPIPPQQAFNVVADVFPMGAADHSLVDCLNYDDDIEKDVKYLVDGLSTREAQ